ncbi:cytochrome P450 [Actinokineospora xionganensis]|uniref:Cytochrome P450 n=1 Tax=Actinokineospora xionganensis TaxID=2684470 RepID=A0ABR7L5D9_9PSEU|nr:cytochrome P450 [Actinokineospora xionganensis]MBC6447890.1 cytochrome P450 [Actinokineospora xionganensis]
MSNETFSGATDSASAERLQMPIPRVDPVRIPEVFAELREERPVCPISLVTGDPALLVTRHEDLKHVLTDREFSRAAVCGEYAPRSQAVRPNPDTIMNMDPPRHTRIRKLAAQAFSAERLDALLPRIRRIADDLMDEMAAMPQPVDLNEAFSRPLPLRIICDMLGVPFEDWTRFTDWTETIMTISSTAEQIGAAYVALRTYFTDLVASKRANPGDDFLSALTRQSDAEGALTESEVISLGTFLLVAGHETSATVLTDGVLNLLTHPDQLADLMADPSLWPGAVEEISRHGIPGVSPFPRIAMADMTLHGVDIPKGTAMVVNYETALRDPRVYDDPEAFDIRRKQPSQVWFGHGPHFCLGAPVARMEVEIGLHALFTRFPNLAMAGTTDDLRWKNNAALGGFEHFLVTW